MKVNPTITSPLFLPLVLICLAAFNAEAQFSGKQVVTPEDYPVFGLSAINNPPFCGMPYSELDLNRITAVPGIGSDGCYTCLKVSNAEDLSKSVHVMVVDRGGVGLDLSTGAFDVLFGQHLSPAPTQWETVAKSFCDGIWRNPTPQSGYASSLSSGPSLLNETGPSNSSTTSMTATVTTYTQFQPTTYTTNPITTSSSTTIAIQTLNDYFASNASTSNDHNSGTKNNNSSSSQVYTSSQISSTTIISVTPWTILLILGIITSFVLS